MADLITLDDFEAAGGDPDAASASLAISAASEMVRQYLNQQVDFVEGDVVVLSGTGTRALLLPECPVVAVNSVTVGDDLLVGADYRVTSGGLLWRLTSDALDDDGVHITSVWTRGYEVTVDYDHGFAEVPGDIRLVVARLAVAIATDSGSLAGLRQETVDNYSYTRDSAATSADAELAVLARRVLRQVPVA